MDKRSHAYDPATLRAIPAVNGTRTGGTRKPRTRTKALSDCISYNVNDPSKVKIFRSTRGRKQRVKVLTVVQETAAEKIARMKQPEAARLAPIGNVD